MVINLHQGTKRILDIANSTHTHKTGRKQIMQFNLRQPTKSLNSEHFRQFIFRQELHRAGVKQFWLSKYQQKLKLFEIHNIWIFELQKVLVDTSFGQGVKNYGIFLRFYQCWAIFESFIHIKFSVNSQKLNPCKEVFTTHIVHWVYCS